MSQELEYDCSLEVKPNIGILFAKYYLFVKKKKDINYEKTFDEKELHDIQYAILLLLNHIGTNAEENPASEEEIKENLKQEISTQC